MIYIYTDVFIIKNVKKLFNVKNKSVTKNKRVKKTFFYIYGQNKYRHYIDVQFWQVQNDWLPLSLS